MALHLGVDGAAASRDLEGGATTDALVAESTTGRAARTLWSALLNGGVALVSYPLRLGWYAVSSVAAGVWHAVWVVCDAVFGALLGTLGSALRWLYLHGAGGWFMGVRIGFWNGAPLESICAQLTGTPVRVWLTPSGGAPNTACEEVVENAFVGLFANLLFLLSSALVLIALVALARWVVVDRPLKLYGGHAFAGAGDPVAAAAAAAAASVSAAQDALANAYARNRYAGVTAAASLAAQQQQQPQQQPQQPPTDAAAAATAAASKAAQDAHLMALLYPGAVPAPAAPPVPVVPPPTAPTATATAAQANLDSSFARFRAILGLGATATQATGGEATASGAAAPPGAPPHVHFAVPPALGAAPPPAGAAAAAPPAATDPGLARLRALVGLGSAEAAAAATAPPPAQLTPEQLQLLQYQLQQQQQAAAAAAATQPSIDALADTLRREERYKRAHRRRNYY